ncbi:MAG: glycosyltransferase [Prevotellaceae bacterium]|jgi:glycosyltransferase involved in cell wall biosynthesis|nr:glycosyltransferase [Prevotellaceae bacterium]
MSHHHKSNIQFSIITITCNAEKVLEHTILSVLSQSYPHIEYIIIDGNSSDGTVDMIRQYAPGLSSWISEPDKGLYDAMNKGLRMATGDYVWFLNAGDTLQHGNTVADMAMVAEQNGMPDVLYGETDLMDRKGNILAARRLKAPKVLTWKSFRMGMLVCHQAFVTKRSITPEYDLQYRFSADFDWCIRCMKNAGTIVNSRLRLVNYLYEGLTTANRKASLKERYAIMCKYYGKPSTMLLHLWFAIRFYSAKWFKGRV